ncbi:MAG: hypothetical protein B7Z78_13440 [Rhodospirillales bacterium 20-60-12]|nr:MAG: hypothetical protein B7Z78_13440 [Rhodospirillales bacterium 20-60-12]
MNPLSPRVIYPLLHAALGWSLVLSFLVFLPTAWWLGAFLLLEDILLIKESVFDPLTEKANPFFWSGVTDLGWYQVGILLLLLLRLLTHKPL